MTSHPIFGVRDVLQCGAILPTVGEGARSMEEVASAVVATLRGHFVDKENGQPTLVLARFYATLRCGDLEPALQDFARAAGTDIPIGPDVRCLTLLASAGEEAKWNDRRSSVAHRAIPLPSIAALRRSPMLAQLVGQLGVDPRQVIEPDPALSGTLARRTYDVFYVPEARDSPHVPAQSDFVIPYGVRSVLGFGGLLPDGVLFAVVLFSSRAIPASAVDAFATLALSTHLAILPHAGGRMFAEPGGITGPPPALSPLAGLSDWQNATRNQLLDARAAVVEEEAVRLGQEVDRAEERIRALTEANVALGRREARRTAIVEGALDCIIGMDSGGRITEFNRAAEATFGYRRADAIGSLLAELIIPYNMRERHRHGLADFLSTGEGPVVGRRIEVNALRADGTEFPVELAVIRAPDTDPPLFNGYVRDLTSVREAIAELNAGRERLAHIARTLQTSLLPPALPEIEGIELAAAFRALGDGYEVGGDFYDAFEISDGIWAFSLGDVCGKGSEAAVITALARYTLRAAAMRNRDPAAVLRTLNEAIHRQHPDQFCTAVYATVEPHSGVVRLALGGHPPPLLLSAAGQVTAVGTSSLLLGPFPEWQGFTDTVRLGVGDTLFFYSDGVTEARAGLTLFGEDRLAATLRGAATDGLPASGAVRLVEATVLDFAGELDDDLAVLAVRRVDPAR